MTPSARSGRGGDAPTAAWRAACAAHLEAAPVPTFIYGARGRTLHARTPCPASGGLLRRAAALTLRTLDNPADPGGRWRACDICFHPAAASVAAALNLRSSTLAASGPDLLLDIHRPGVLVERLAAMRTQITSLEPSDDPWDLGLAGAARDLSAALDAHMLQPGLPQIYVVDTPPPTWLTRAAAIQIGLSPTLHPPGALSPRLLNQAVVDLIDPDLLRTRCFELDLPHLREQSHLLRATYTPARDLAAQVSAVRAATR